MRFKPSLVDSKKYTSPMQSEPVSEYHSSEERTSSAIKVIDLRNPQIRKLVMESLNDIIEERKKSRMIK
jgi:hypothetical protein